MQRNDDPGKMRTGIFSSSWPFRPQLDLCACRGRRPGGACEPGRATLLAGPAPLLQERAEHPSARKEAM